MLLFQVVSKEIEKLDTTIAKVLQRIIEIKIHRTKNIEITVHL